MSARTRRQKAALGVPADDSEDLSTGNGSASTPSKSTKRTPSKKRSRSALKEEDEKENIFLFAPNLIGTISLCAFQRLLHFPYLTLINILTLACRVFPSCPCFRIPLLHAPPPSHVFSSLQRLVPARRIGWLCGALL